MAPALSPTGTSAVVAVAEPSLPLSTQALAKLNHMQNLVVSMVSGITPSARSRTGQQSFILEVLCLLLDIIAPKLRPVSARQPLLSAVAGVLPS